MRSLEQARHEVEVELERRSASIDNRLRRLRKELLLPASVSVDFVRKHPLTTSLGFAVVAGAVAAIAFSRGKAGSGKQNSRVSLADAYADRIGDAMGEAVAGGLTPDEALQAAIRANPPVIVEADGVGQRGILRDVADRIVKSVTATLIDVATVWVTDLLQDRKSPS
jgi:hypothetical protein